MRVRHVRLICQATTILQRIASWREWVVPAYMPCRVSLPRGPWNKCGKEPLNNQEPTFFREDDIFAHVYLTPTTIIYGLTISAVSSIIIE
jgi:hypothetical protein